MINNDKIFFTSLVFLLINIASLILGIYPDNTGAIVQYILFGILAIFALLKMFCPPKSKYIKWLYSNDLFKIS